MLEQGHFGHPDIPFDVSDLTEQQLAAKDAQGIPELFTAAQRGHAKSVAAYVNTILSSKLEYPVKVELLSGKNLRGKNCTFCSSS